MTVDNRQTDTAAHPSAGDGYWLAALPPRTYQAECASIAARARTLRALRDGEDLPEHVLDRYRDTDDEEDRWPHH